MILVSVFVFNDNSQYSHLGHVVLMHRLPPRKKNTKKNMHQSSIINSPMLIAANGNFLVSQTHDVSDQQLWIALAHFLSIAQRQT